MERDRFKSRVQRALALTDAKGIERAASAPPLHRLLWALGVRVPPPLMAGFWVNALLMGVLFGLGWGVLMWLLVWGREGMGLAVMAAAAALAGLLFGLAMAYLNRRQAHRHGVPGWRQFES